MSALVRLGLVPRCYLLTTTGRKTGKPRTNPVVPVEHTGGAGWSRPTGPCPGCGMRATGRVRLTRWRDTRDYLIREIPLGEAGPVLKQYVRIAPATRAYFQAQMDSAVEDFAAEADRHLVFELTPVGEDPHPDRRGR